MKILLSIGIFLTIGLCFFSCKSKKPMEKNATSASTNQIGTPTEVDTILDDSELISMVKGACHGSCPIYTLTILNNGKCEFNGKRFCKKLGAFTATLSSTELNLLKQKIAGLDMASYPEQIQSMIPDFPSTEITCTLEDGTPKSVWWRSGAPGELEEMAIVLDKFRQDLSWEVDVHAPLPAGTIENEMLISLKDGIEAAEFAKAYKAYDLTPLKQLVPKQNYWLFKFDTQKISGVEMLNLLNKSEKIHNVEFNKELEQRH